MEITQEQFEEVKNKALQYFKKHRKVTSPIFGEINVNPAGFNHIEYDSKKHKRSMQEAYIRYLCFLNMAYIIENSYLYQDFSESYEVIEFKVNKNKKTNTRLVQYYGFIAIVNNKRQRIKVIVKFIEGREKFEYVSVIPVWKTTKYGPQLYIDNFEEDFN